MTSDERKVYEQDIEYGRQLQVENDQLRAAIALLETQLENLKLRLSDIHDLTLSEADDWETAFGQIQYLIKSNHPLMMDVAAYARIEQDNERLEAQLAEARAVIRESLKWHESEWQHDTSGNKVAVGVCGCPGCTLGRAALYQQSQPIQTGGMTPARKHSENDDPQQTI